MIVFFFRHACDEVERGQTIAKPLTLWPGAHV